MTQEADFCNALELAVHQGMQSEWMTIAKAVGTQEHYNQLLHEIAVAVLASPVWAAHDAQVRAEARQDLSAEIEAVFDEHYFDGKVLPAYVGAESAARLATIRLIVSKAEETGSTIAESDVTSCCATG